MSKDVQKDMAALDATIKDLVEIYNAIPNGVPTTIQKIIAQKPALSSAFVEVMTDLVLHQQKLSNVIDVLRLNADAVRGHVIIPTAIDNRLKSIEDALSSMVKMQEALTAKPNDQQTNGS